MPTQKSTTRRSFLKTAAAAAVAAPFVAEASTVTSEAETVALRVVALWAEAGERGRRSRDYIGSHYLAEQVDLVTAKGSEYLIPEPSSEFFVPIFCKAVREIGEDDEDYIALKNLVARLYAGADLEAIAAEARRQEEARDEQARRESEARRRERETEADRLRSEVLAVLNNEDDPRHVAVYNEVLDLCLEVNADLNHPDVFLLAAGVAVNRGTAIAAEEVTDSDEARRAWMETNPGRFRPWMSQKLLANVRAALKGDV